MAQPKAGAFQGVRALSHLGIAVKSIESTLGFFEGVLGLSCEHVEEVSSQKVRAAFLPLGATRLELLEPTAPESPIARFLEKRGEGLHHLAFRVEDVRAELARLEGEGFELVDRAPRPGAHGRTVAFLHPRSAHGALIELVQDAS